MREVPEPARALAETFLREADAVRPGLVEGLYLVGSVALGDFQPHESDVDYVAVVTDPLLPGDIAALQRAHGMLPRGRHFDGLHVPWSALAADPGLCPPVPVTYAHRFEPAARAGDSVVTWHELAWHGVALRGPASPKVWVGPDALAAYTRRNLETYWRPWVQGKGRLLAFSARGASWGVLGVSRLRYLLATGQMTSKTGAGRYALEAFPERWRPIVEECLRSRAGEGTAMNPFTRRRMALDFVEEAIEGGASLQVRRGT